MDQVQTSTLLHYRFWWFNRRLMEMHTQGDFLWLSFLWPRTNDTLWVNPCSPAPGIIRNYSRLSFVETSAQKQRNRSKSTSEKSFHVCSVQYPNELVGFPTHRYYRGCPTPHRLPTSRSKGVPLETPQVFNLSHKEFANISKKAWLCKSWRETNPSNSALRIYKREPKTTKLTFLDESHHSKITWPPCTSNSSGCPLASSNASIR